MILLCMLWLWCLSASGQAQVVRPVVGEVSHYVSVEGEDLLDIAQRRGLAIDHLCFANGWPTNATDIYPGTPVIIPGQRVLPADPPRDGIVINLPERGLYFFAGGHFQRFFPVSIGDGDKCPTPEGRFSIIEKIMNPTWYPPAWAHRSGPVPPGPENPLGDRWLGLSGGRYGIHSTYSPVNIGGDVTRGCVRMYPEALHQLFEQVKVGMPVRIEYETAKIGRCPDGRLILQCFPDAYKRSDPARRAERLVRQLGLPWSQELNRQAALGQGLPLPLGGRS